MSTGVRETLSTVQVAQAIGISQKLLLKLQKVKNSPFKAGEHYRFQGTTTAAAMRWFPELTDLAFNEFTRHDHTHTARLPR